MRLVSYRRALQVERASRAEQKREAWHPTSTLSAARRITRLRCILKVRTLVQRPQRQEGL
jgi:hypothetical protein